MEDIRSDKMEGLITIIIAIVIIIALCALSVYMNYLRNRDMDELDQKDKLITSVYKWIRHCLETDYTRTIIKDYDQKNNTNYEEVLINSFKIIDDFMENRGNDLMGYISLCITTIPGIIEILCKLNLPVPSILGEEV